MSPTDKIQIVRNLLPHQAGSRRHECERRELPYFISLGWRVADGAGVDVPPSGPAAKSAAPQATATGT